MTFTEHSISMPRNGNDRLADVWIWLALGALGASSLLAVVMLAFRFPIAAAADGASAYRVQFVAHAGLAALAWSLAAPTTRLIPAIGQRARGLAWAGFVCAATGLATAILVGALAPSPPALISFFPRFDHPLYVIGLAAFGLGVLATGLAAALPGRRDDEGSRLLWAWLALAIALGLVVWASIQPLDFAGHVRDELVAWGAGHALQFFNVGVLVWAWFRLADAAGVAGGPQGRWRKLAIALAVLPALAALAIPALYPLSTEAYLLAFGDLMRWAVWPVPTVVALMLVVALRRSSKAEPAVRAILVLSLALYLVGIVIGPWLNARSLLVSAHQHALLLAVTVAWLGVLLVGERRVKMLPVLVWTLLGLGCLLLLVAMAWAGVVGAPRKTPAGPGGKSAIVVLGFLMTLGGVLAATILLWLCAVLLGVARFERACKSASVLAMAVLLALVVGAFGRLPSGVAAGKLGFAALQGRQIGTQQRHRQHVSEKRLAEIRLRFDQSVEMLNSREFERAAQALHRVLELDPKLPTAHANMGFALLGLEQPGSAADFFASAIALNPKQINAYYGMALALEAQREYAPAIEMMQIYLQRARPEDPYRARAEAVIERIRKDSAAVPATGKAAQ